MTIAFVMLILANLFTLYFFSGIKTSGRVSTEGTVSLMIASQETPTPTPSPGGGGGGGGAAVYEKALTFSIEPNLLKTKLKIGETFKTSIKIKNFANKDASFRMDITSLKDFISLSDEMFVLKAGEEKIVYITFISTQNSELGTKTGKIKITSGRNIEEVQIILEIRSKKVLFDVSLNIPSKYKELKIGEELLAQMTLFNLGDVDKADVSLFYEIKDFEGNSLMKKEETIAVETQASLSRTFLLPKNLKEGEYVIAVSVRYDESVGTASDIFYIGRKRSELVGKEYLLLVVIIIIASLSISIVLHYHNKKLKEVLQTHRLEIKEATKKIQKGQMKIAEAIKLSERLKLQLALLNKAYEKGYIGKEAYEKSRERIGEVAKNLKKKYL